jgi:F420-dependent oxidoreductase-like protein
MRRLPPHHVPRPRLTDRCANYQVIVVEAAGGYGKTVLGTELVDRWRAVGIDVQVEHEGMAAPLLAARLRAAALHAGFTDAAAAAAVSGPGDDAFGAVDTLVRALAGEPCAFVIDDAHHARPDAGALIDHIASRLEAEHRLVVLARHLPRGAERLRRAENLHLTSADLAMTPDETLELCRSGFELKIGPHTAKVLDRATGGWTAATVLAAARAARTGEALGDMAEAAIGPGHPTEAVAAILDEAVVALGPSSRRGLAQVARLPLLDAGLVDLAAGEDGFFERSLSADAMRSAAKEYGRRGELEWALQLLLASGDAGEAASMLAATPPEVVETMDALELGAVFDQLPLEAVDAHPSVLLVVARACRLATRFDQGAVLLERAGGLAARSGDSALQRAIAVEVAHDLLRELRHREAEDAARWPPGSRRGLMKLGLHVPDFTWPAGPSRLGPQLAEVAQAAEEAGFDRLSVMDHVWQIGHIGPPEHEMLEAYTTLGYLAGQTRRISLLTMVTGVVYRSPGLLAKMVSTLDVLSGGRAWLGIGAAWNEEESRGLDLFFPPMAERFERLEEALQICLQMWSDDDGPFDGRHYHLARTLNRPQPLSRPHPPILIGGSGEKKTLRLVARYAQACNLFGGGADLAHKFDVLRAHCQTEGRPYEDIQKTVGYTFDVGEKGERVGQVIEELKDLAALGVQVAHGRVQRVWDLTPLEVIGKEVVPALAGL